MEWNHLVAQIVCEIWAFQLTINKKTKLLLFWRNLKQAKLFSVIRKCQRNFLKDDKSSRFVGSDKIMTRHEKREQIETCVARRIFFPFSNQVFEIKSCCSTQPKKQTGLQALHLGAKKKKASHDLSSHCEHKIKKKQFLSLALENVGTFL